MSRFKQYDPGFTIESGPSSPAGYSSKPDWGGLAYDTVSRNADRILGGIFSWLGLGGGGKNNNSGGGNGNTPIIIHQNTPNGAGQPATDYGKYIIYGVIGLIFFAILFMGFSAFMNRKK